MLNVIILIPDHCLFTYLLSTILVDGLRLFTFRHNCTIRAITPANFEKCSPGSQRRCSKKNNFL